MKKQVLAAASALAMVTAAPPANAAYTITFAEVGNDVMAFGSGTLNITGLNLRNTNGDSAFISPGRNIAVIGAGNADLYYATLSFQGLLGSGGGVLQPTSSTGSVVGELGGLNFLAVPGGYRSGAVVSGTSTFANSTFQSLGLARGTVVVGFNSGVNADTITIQVPLLATVSIPEPATWGLMLAGFGLVGAGLRVRRRNTTVTYA